MESEWIAHQIPRSLPGFIVVAIALFGAGMPGVAEEPPQREVTEMEEVEVRARSLEERLSSELARYGNEVEVITREELDKSGIGDVGQALERLVPGLYVAPKNGRADYVDASLKGSRTSGILWLVDGVRINNRLFASTPPLDSISSHQIKRIEVLKGGQGLFYGTQAVGGVVNIITYKPGPKTGGTLGVSGGGHQDRTAFSRISTARGDHRFMVFGSHDEADGFEPFRSAVWDRAGGRERERGFDVTNVALKYASNPTSSSRVSLHLQRNDAKVDFAGPERFSSVNDRDEHILYLKWDHRLSDDFTYFVKAYWHDWWTRFSRINVSDAGDLVEVNDRDRWGFEDYGVNWMGSYTTSDGSKWLFGADYQNYWGEDFVLRIEKQTETVLAPFVQFRPHLWFSPQTSLALGGRYNHADPGGETFIWNATARHPLSSRTYLRVSTGKSFRLPSAFELFVVDPDFPAGNPDLDPETSLDLNLGLGGHHRIGTVPVSWDIGGFYRETEDLIQAVGAPLRFQNTNATVETQGFEAKLGLRPSPGWTVQLNGTYAEATPENSDQQIDNVPESFFKNVIRYDAPGDRWGVQWTNFYVGEIFDTLTGVGREKYGQYYVADVSAYYSWEDSDRFTLRVENVFDREYASNIGSADTVLDGDSDNDFRFDHLGVPLSLILEYRHEF